MNVYTIKLEPIELRHDQAYYALHTMIHTILVQRTIGIPIRPKEISSPAFDDLIYTVIDDKAILDKVDTKLKEITTTIKPIRGKARIYLSLCSDTTKYGLMGAYTEHIEWERWYIEFSFGSAASSLEKPMNAILEQCDVPPQHIPVNNFYFDIVDADVSTMFDILKPFFR